MRLARFWADDLPGIPDRFDFTVEPGLNLITGPNGIGKSSVARALVHLLWPGRAGGREAPLARAAFVLDGRTLEAACRGGRRTDWTQDGLAVAPPALPGEHLAGCYHLDVLDLMPANPHPDDGLLARDVARQMSGGVDLEAARQACFSVKGSAPARRRDEVTAARRKRDEVVQRQAELARRRDELADMRRNLQAAQDAGARLAVLQAADRRAAMLQDLQAVDQDLAELPPGAAVVQPQDPQNLARLRVRQRQLADDEADLRRQLDEIAKELDALGGPLPDDGSVPDAALPRALQDLRQAVAGAREADLRMSEAAAAAARAGAAATGPGGAPPLAANDPNFVDRAAALIDRVHGCRREVEHLRIHPPAAAVAAPGPARPGRGWILAGLALGLASALALAWSGALIVAAAAGATGAVLLVVGLALMRRARGRADDSPAAGPAEGDPLARAQSDLAAAQAGLANHLARAGLALDAENPSLLLLLEKSRRAEEASAQSAQLQGRRDAAAAGLQEALAAVNRVLGRHGAPGVADAAAAEQAAASLQGRWERRRNLVEKLQSSRERLVPVERDRQRAQEDAAALLQALHLDPGPDEERRAHLLAEAKPRHDQLKSRALDLTNRAAELAREIAAGRSLFTEEEARSWLPEGACPARAVGIAQESSLAEQRDAWNRQIGGLEQQIESTASGHALEDAHAELSAAEEVLADTFARHLLAAVGQDLLDAVRKEYQNTARPAVLLAAEDMLRVITGRPYDLQVAQDPQDQDELRVLDRETGGVFTPATLSAGTRVQLLFAVRLGFLAQAETGASPPLILDDVLLASDAQRFTAAAVSLGNLAASGRRQILYLCAHPGEVSAWRRILAERGLPEPHVVDLAQVRGRAAAIPASPMGIWDPAADGDRLPPSPQGMDAAAYAQALGVPAPQPWAPVESLHLFHLLPDRLPLLRDLLLAGTATLAAWRIGAADLVRAGRVAPADGDLLQARVRVWECVLESWRRGRARPVSKRFLEECGVLSPIMLPKVQELLAEVNGVGRDLVQALRQRRIPNFRNETIDRLEEALQAAGYLPQGQILARAQILQAVQSSAPGSRGLDLGHPRPDVLGPERSEILNTEATYLLADRFLDVLSE